MKVEKIKLKDVVMYEKNAKLHPKKQIEQIKQSIQTMGFNDPIAIDESNVIIEGHGRYLALKELGYEEVEVIRLTHLTEEKKKAYRLIHNKLTMNSDFDISLLDEELKLIDEINMSEYDFDVLSEKEEIIEDEAPEVDEENEPITKLGDIWKLGNHYLMCGDSTSKEDIEKLMSAGGEDA